MLEGARTGRFDRYIPRGLLERLDATPDAPVLTKEGSVAFVDISGFTRLSERLARSGREGAERLVDTISTSFGTLLLDAYANGASLLKFGGDALLLWFEGEEHPQRACASAIAVRRTLRRIGRIPVGESSVVLRMSVGVHSGSYEMFLVGGSHRELLVAGPAVSSVVAMESAAGTGQILLSERTAKLLPERCLGPASGPGVLLARAPAVRAWTPAATRPSPSDDTVAACLSTELRAHLEAVPAAPEHRIATVSFLQFGEFDELIGAGDAAASAEAVDEVVRAAQEAADRYEVCFLGSDIASDGGKLLFSAGAPRAVGDDEERMLLAMRQIVEAGTRLPVRIGVNRGYVFTGEVGPLHRRTYAVMGDVTNLAARLSAKAPWRAVFTTAGVLRRTRTRFATTAVPPFTVKGKSRPIEAFVVEGTVRAAPAASPGTRQPLIGRDRELATIRRVVAGGVAGAGALIELIGENGSGKSRLLSEARELSSDMGPIYATCDNYTQAVPYFAWRDLLGQLLGLAWEDPQALALERLRTQTARSDPELLPWLPLLAMVIGVDAPTTRAVEELSPEFRTAKLHEVVLRFLAPALRKPTLVVVEHAHLMDEASAALLEALADGLGRSSWVVIVTRRNLEGGFVASGPQAVRLELGPLSPSDALALAEGTPEAHAIPPHALALAVERSGGNPEFLLDLLSALASDSDVLPESIETATGARIDRLGPGDRTLVRRAAVLGLRFRPANLRHVLEPGTELPDEETWTRLSGMLAADGDGYRRFKSPILCEVAYDRLPFGERRRLHAAVGRALERDRGSGVDADPAVLSLHFSRAGDHERAWRYALMGAERAAARFAVADAAVLYRRAIASHRGAGVTPPEVAAVWESLGEALAQVGELREAEDAFTAARRLLAEDPIAQARLCFRHGQLAERSELPRAVRWMRRGLRTLEDVGDREARIWRARLIADLAWIRQRERRYRDAERLCREALSEGEAIHDLPAQARACYTLDWALFEQGRAGEAVYSSRALEIYRELGDPDHESRVLNNLGGFAYWGGRWREALDLYRQSGACSQRAGDAAGVAFTDGNIGEILSDQGRLDEAAIHLRRARRVWSATGGRQEVAIVNMNLGRLAVRAGRAREGVTQLRAALVDMRRCHLDFYADLAGALIAEGEALGGDPEVALALSDEQLGSASRYTSLLRRARGIALARIGDRTSAEHELELAVEAARDRDEDYEAALGLDALLAVGTPSAARAFQRDAILARLDVVALPVIAELPGAMAESVG